MSWIEYGLLALLLNSLSGSCLFGVWHWLGKRLEKNLDIRLFYGLLKVVLLLYLLPLLFGWLVLESRTDQGWTGRLYLTSGVMQGLRGLLWLIWLSGVFRQAAALWRWGRKCRAIRQHRVQTTPKDRQLMEECCARLNINPARISLEYSSIIGTPLLYGVRHPRIYLPLLESLTEQEKKAALLHELTHYRQHDTRWRFLAELACCFHWFNPLARRLPQEMEEWSEACCDYRSGEAFGNMRHYFSIVAGCTIDQSASAFVSQFYTDQEYLEKRLKRVRSYQQARKKGRWFPFVCGALFVCLSAGTIWVAAVGTVDLYERLYQETVVETEEAFRKEALPASGYQGQLADSLSWMVEEPFRAVWLLEWTVEDGELHSTSPFSQQAGESVKVSVSTEPAGQAVRVGIVCPSGELRYIQTSSSVNHAFLAPESGEYRVYVENRSGIPVRVQVSYVR